MKTMHLFHLSYKDLGDEAEIIPKIPKYRLDDEESETPRVCAAITILQCLQSKGIFLNETLWENTKLSLYIYEADVLVEDIEQPTLDKVEDVWFTGEMWVTQTYKWKKAGNYIIELGEEITECNYLHRYYVHEIGFSISDNNGSLFGLDGYHNNFFFTERGPTQVILN